MAEAARARALLALWNDVDPALEAEYNAWHAGEHVPERLTVPGILWGLRYARVEADAAPRYLTLYGLRDAAVLDSEPYQRLLREPTPMSRRMRPALRNITRWVCTLHMLRGLERGSHLALWVESDDAAAAEGAADGRHEPAVGRLLAVRLPEARPLPWLQEGQASGIEGRWLAGVALEAPRALPGASLYRRLTG